MGGSSNQIRRRVENEVEVCIRDIRINSVLVAVSGGADSVALLTAFCRVAPRLNIRVEAINCNFHLRGEESDRDSMFTANLCKQLGIKLHALDYDVEDYLRNHPGLSTEMACRELRYADFFRVMEEEGFDRVAVAHNADDDIETMMLNLLRGSGSRGLKGMDKDNGKVIRPLLGVSRKEIEKYIKDIGSGYIIDSSNLSSEYRRNFIRRDILPLLESRWIGARKSLYKTVGIMKEEAVIIEDFYRKQLQSLMTDKNTLLVYSEGVTLGTVLRFLEPFGGNTEIADEIMSSIGKEFKQRIWKLSDQFEARLERDHLIIADIKEKETVPRFVWTPLLMNQYTMEEIKGNRNHNIVYLPSDSSAYTIRPARKGDRMSPLGMRGSRLVSDIIGDAKLNRNQKSMVRVLERNSDGEIIWVVGLKRSRHDLICENSTLCYKLSCLTSEPTSDW